MVDTYSTKKCPKCGGQMIVKRKPTFDEILFECKCRKCGYFTSHEKVI